MIATWHGAFDYIGDHNGISVLTRRIRELAISKAVYELNCGDQPSPTVEDISSEPNILIAFSNGVMDALHYAAEILWNNYHNVNGCSSVHCIFLDPVRKGAAQVFNRRKLFLDDNILSCWCFLRQRVRMFPPYHTDIAKRKPPEFVTFNVPYDHDGVASSPVIHDRVCHRVMEIFNRGSL
jgi:hypothetical protein